MESDSKQINCLTTSRIKTRQTSSSALPQTKSSSSSSSSQHQEVAGQQQIGLKSGTRCGSRKRRQRSEVSATICHQCGGGRQCNGRKMIYCHNDRLIVAKCERHISVAQSVAHWTLVRTNYRSITRVIAIFTCK